LALHGGSDDAGFRFGRGPIDWAFWPWLAPEEFESEVADATSTPASDMYAFAISLYEVLIGEEPYKKVQHELDAAGVDFRALITGENGCPALRPNLDDLPSDVPEPVKDLMKRCWAASPSSRPSAAEAVAILQSVIPTVPTKRAAAAAAVAAATATAALTPAQAAAEPIAASAPATSASAFDAPAAVAVEVPTDAAVTLAALAAAPAPAPAFTPAPPVSPALHADDSDTLQGRAAARLHITDDAALKRCVARRRTRGGAPLRRRMRYTRCCPCMGGGDAGDREVMRLPCLARCRRSAARRVATCSDATPRVRRATATARCHRPRVRRVDDSGQLVAATSPRTAAPAIPLVTGATSATRGGGGATPTPPLATSSLLPATLPASEPPPPAPHLAATSHVTMIAATAALQTTTLTATSPASRLHVNRPTPPPPTRGVAAWGG